MHLQLKEDDVRFGFSLIGGEDEGFLPRIDEVAPGKYANSRENNFLLFSQISCEIQKIFG